MARPVKRGLDYFPFDVDTFEDERIEAISGEFGIKGEAAVIKLLCAIYKKEGYFIVWSDLAKAQLLKRLPGASIDFLDQVVNRLVKWGYFDEDLFNSDMILTSSEIQNVYFEATKRRKLPKPTKYLINDDINSTNSEVNVNINTQIKRKEIKVNKTKVNNKDIPPLSTPVPNKIQEEFELLWGMHPRQVGQKDVAFETYSDERLIGLVTFDQVKAKIEAFKQQVKVNDTPTTYIKTAGKWFSEKRWNDEYDTKPPKPKKPFGTGKQEVEPKWAKPGYVAPVEQQEVSAEQQEQIDALLEQIKEGRGKPIR